MMNGPISLMLFFITLAIFAIGIYIVHVGETLMEQGRENLAFQKKLEADAHETKTQLSRVELKVESVLKDTTDSLQILQLQTLPTAFLIINTKQQANSILKLQSRETTATGFVVSNGSNIYVLTVRHFFGLPTSLDGVPLLDAGLTQDFAFTTTLLRAQEHGRLNHRCSVVGGGSSSSPGPEDWALLSCPGLNHIAFINIGEFECQPTFGETENAVSPPKLLCVAYYSFNLSCCHYCCFYSQLLFSAIQQTIIKTCMMSDEW